MALDTVSSLPHCKLLEVIQIQTEIGQFGLDLASVKTLVVERILSLLDTDGAVIEMAEGEDMVYQAAAGIAASQLGLRLKRSASLSGLCMQERVSLYCEDALTDPRVDVAACQRMHLRSMILIPLVHQGHAVGVLKALSVHPAHFSPCDISLLELLSGLVSSSMYFSAKYSGDALFKLATRDGLTGLANRTHFMDRLESAMELGQRAFRPIAVLVMDMDGLKQRNDVYGHRIGDALIQEFGKRLQTSIRTSDTAARLGGDEFAVLLMPVDAPLDVQDILERIDAQLRLPFVFEDVHHVLQASMGLAQFPSEAADARALLDLADRRMYEIKKGRRQQASEREKKHAAG